MLTRACACVCRYDLHGGARASTVRWLSDAAQHTLPARFLASTASLGDEVSSREAGVLVSASEDGSCRALDAGSGEVLWGFSSSSPVAALQLGFVSSPATPAAVWMLQSGTVRIALLPDLRPDHHGSFGGRGSCAALAQWNLQDRRCSTIGANGNVICTAAHETHALHTYVVEGRVPVPCWSGSGDDVHSSPVSHVIVTDSRAYSVAGGEIRAWQLRNSVQRSYLDASGTRSSSTAAVGQLLWASPRIGSHDRVTALLPVHDALLVSAGDDGVVKAWDPRMGALVWERSEHQAGVVRLVPCPAAAQSGQGTAFVTLGTRATVGWREDGSIAWRLDMRSDSLLLPGDCAEPLHEPVPPATAPAAAVTKTFHRLRPTCGAAIPRSQVVAISLDNGAVALVGSSDGGLRGLLCPVVGQLDTVSALRACEAAANPVEEIAATQHHIVARLSLGLFAWRRVDMGDADRPPSYEGCGGYFMPHSELAQARFTHFLVQGSTCYACTAAGSIVCVDLDAEQRMWHTEALFVDCTGLHMTNGQLFAGTTNGLMAVNVQRMSVAGLCTEYYYQVWNAFVRYRGVAKC